MQPKNLLKLSHNLSARERGLQVTRLFTSFTVIVLIIAALVGSLLSHKIYISRINCAHLDVSYGLYKSLRTLVSLSPSILEQESSAGVYPMDSSLTNSEITVLTNYAEEQVANAPQYTFTSMWRWCYGNYNITKVHEKDGKMKFNKHNDVISCSSDAKEYVFDYRQELADIGLQSILAYAYQSSSFDDNSYQKATAKRESKYKKVPGALFFAAASQAVLLILTYFVYLDRGDNPKVKKQQLFMMNFLALLSMASFLAMAIGVGLLTQILVEVKLEVLKSLNDFGVTFHLGKAWFSLLWASCIFALLSMASWTLPLWCANPPEDIDDDFEAGIPRHHRRTTHNANENRGHLRSVSNPLLNEAYVTDDINDERKESPDMETATRLVERQPTFTTEEELRKLGESLSRSVSVRHLNRKTSNKKTQPTFTTVTEDPFDSASLIENDDQSSHHYREETYDGYQNRQRYTEFSHSKHDRNVLATLNSAMLLNNENDASSFLNEDEIHFLDHNNFINKMT